MSGRTVGARLVAVGLLVVVPMLVAFSILDTLVETLGREAETALRRDMQGVLRRAVAMGSLRTRAAWVFERMFRHPWTPTQLAPRLARVARRNRAVVEVFLFDAAGRRVELPGIPHDRVVASQQFLRALLDEQAPVPAKLIAAFAGNPLAPRLLAAAPGVFVDLVNGERRSWAAWWRLQDRRQRTTGHAVIVLHRSGVEPDRLLDLSLSEARRLVGARGLQCGWFDPVAVGGELRPRASGAGGASFAASLQQELAALPVGSLRPQIGDRPVVLQTTDTGVVLFCIANILPSLTVDVAWWRTVISGVAVLLGLALLIGGSGMLPPLLRLRGKLVLLFLLGGGVPLVILSITAVIDRHDREEVLLAQCRQAQVAALTRLDGDLTAWFAPIVARYERALATMARTASPGTAVPPALCAWIARQGDLIIQAMVTDRRGKLMYYHHGDPGMRGSRLATTRDVMRDYSARILQSYNVERTSLGAETARSTLVANIAGRATAGLEQARTIQVQSIGDQVMLSYLGFIHREAQRAEQVLLVMHRSRTAQIRYLQWLRRIWGRPGPLAPRFVALPVTAGADWPAFPRAQTGLDSTLRAMRDLVVATRLPQHDVLQIGGDAYLLSALPGRLLDGYVLMLAQPYEAIARATHDLNRRLWVLSAFMLALAAAAAFATSSLLLQPIAQLGHGLHALHERQFRLRLEPGRVVELAQVADRFNVILADLRDLEIARTVQEHLWPNRSLAGPGYVVAGQCATAADLGGDHHDWFALPDGRVVVAVGDVAGHGVPSALVVAAAKVELALLARRRTGPAEILTAMNQAFHEQVGKVRPMTFWLGIYDPASGGLDCASAGHTFPIVVQEDADPVMVGAPGYPLGSRRKAVFTQAHVDLSRGAVVVAYTDGLIEARNDQGEQFGYERLLAAVESMTANTTDPALLASGIQAAVNRWSPRMPPEDDQTLVVLHVAARKTQAA